MFRPFLVALLLYARCVACKYAFICDSKGAFGGFYGADVYLYGLRSLRGLWGFCVRVELGGFGACGVFASVLSFCSCFYLVSCFVCLSSCPLLVLSLCGLFGAFFRLGLSFPFPFRTMRKKKGRKVFCSLRPLLSCCGLVYKSLNITVICCGSSFQCR